MIRKRGPKLELMSINRYLDAIKRRYDLETDYQLAQFLGCGAPRIKTYRGGVSAPDDAFCVQIARLLDEPTGRVLAIAAAERNEGDTAIVAAWRAVAALCRTEQQVIKASAKEIASRSIASKHLQAQTAQRIAARNAATTRPS
jgi:hypothetical protein